MENKTDAFDMWHYLLEIEPPKAGGSILRQPKKDRKDWWN